MKKPEMGSCKCGCQVYHSVCSHIPLATWSDFIKGHSGCIRMALDNKENGESFNICKKLE